MKEKDLLKKLEEIFSHKSSILYHNIKITLPLEERK